MEEQPQHNDTTKPYVIVSAIEDWVEKSDGKTVMRYLGRGVGANCFGCLMVLSPTAGWWLVFYTVMGCIGGAIIGDWAGLGSALWCAGDHDDARATQATTAETELLIKKETKGGCSSSINTWCRTWFSSGDKGDKVVAVHLKKISIDNDSDSDGDDYTPKTLCT